MDYICLLVCVCDLINHISLLLFYLRECQGGLKIMTCENIIIFSCLLEDSVKHMAWCNIIWVGMIILELVN